ncbi:hypothetical protein [Citrobacter koseri]|uniref:hypothetical protein n=1 Tax=Citrobacter koseri TaxID=545 RepID=UPI001F3F369F|nr:hypothetical protein [Citrobacter koseri]
MKQTTGQITGTVGDRKSTAHYGTTGDARTDGPISRDAGTQPLPVTLTGGKIEIYVIDEKALPEQTVVVPRLTYQSAGFQQGNDEH